MREGFSCNCKTIMTRCPLSFQNVTELSNTQWANLISSNCSILTTDLNCTFSSKKCFFSAEWSDLEVLGVDRELLVKACEKHAESMARRRLWQSLPWPGLWGPGSLSPLRLFGDQSWCPAPTAEPVRWTVKEPRLDRQRSSSDKGLVFLCKSSLHICKHV